MKLMNKLSLCFLLSAALVACEDKETENISYETNYATFELTGGETYTIAKGTTFVEPGVTAFAGEAELSVETKGEVNTSELGIYVLEYSAVNPDGYAASTSRTVVVYDPAAPNTDISGLYTTRIVRTEANGTQPRNYGPFSIDIVKVAPGIFYSTDLLGGVYDQGFAYGGAYAMTGYFALNSDNTLSYLTSHVEGWGDSLENFYDAVYNPETGGITWKSVYASHDIFTVTLNK